MVTYYMPKQKKKKENTISKIHYPEILGMILSGYTVGQISRLFRTKPAQIKKILKHHFKLNSNKSISKGHKSLILLYLIGNPNASVVDIVLKFKVLPSVAMLYKRTAHRYLLLLKQKKYNGWIERAKNKAWREVEDIPNTKDYKRNWLWLYKSLIYINKFIYQEGRRVS